MRGEGLSSFYMRGKIATFLSSAETGKVFQKNAFYKDQYVILIFFVIFEKEDKKLVLNP